MANRVRRHLSYNRSHVWASNLVRNLWGELNHLILLWGLLHRCIPDLSTVNRTILPHWQISFLFISENRLVHNQKGKSFPFIALRPLVFVHNPV